MPPSGPAPSPSGSPATGARPTLVERPSFVEGLVLPGLIIGVPAIMILGILATQLAVGAAWLPVVRRWLHRRV